MHPIVEVFLPGKLEGSVHPVQKPQTIWLEEIGKEIERESQRNSRGNPASLVPRPFTVPNMNICKFGTGNSISILPARGQPLCQF